MASAAKNTILGRRRLVELVRRQQVDASHHVACSTAVLRHLLESARETQPRRVYGIGRSYRKIEMSTLTTSLSVGKRQPGCSSSTVITSIIRAGQYRSGNTGVIFTTFPSLGHSVTQSLASLASLASRRLRPFLRDGPAVK